MKNKRQVCSVTWSYVYATLSNNQAFTLAKILNRKARALFLTRRSGTQRRAGGEKDRDIARNIIPLMRSVGLRAYKSI